MDMSALLVKMLIFVVLMVIGYVMARSGHAGPEFTKSASELVINVFMSATILNAVLVCDVSLSTAQLLNTMLVLSVAILICYVLGAAVTRVLPIQKDKKPLFELLIAVMNNMFIALPVVESICGPEAVFYCSLSCIPFNVLLYTYGVYRLKSGAEGDKGGLRIKNIVSVPLIATLVALFIFVVRLPVPQVVRQLAGTMAPATMPLSMLVIGSSLGSVSLLDSFKDWRLYISSFFSLVVSPLIVYLVCSLLTSDPVLLFSAVIIAAAPTGIVVSVLAIQYGRDAIFTSEGILHSTVLSMFTIPLVVWLLMRV